MPAESAAELDLHDGDVRDRKQRLRKLKRETPESAAELDMHGRKSRERYQHLDPGKLKEGNVTVGTSARGWWPTTPRPSKRAMEEIANTNASRPSRMDRRGNLSPSSIAEAVNERPPNAWTELNCGRRPPERNRAAYLRCVSCSIEVW